MESDSNAGNIFPMEDVDMPVEKEETKTAVGESSEDEPLRKMSKLSLKEEMGESARPMDGGFFKTGSAAIKVAIPTFPGEKLEDISDHHAFLICIDCSKKMPLQDNAYNMPLKIEEDGTSYSLKIPYNSFTKDDTTEIDLPQILLMSRPIVGGKRRIAAGPKTFAQAIEDSKKYYSSFQLKKIALNVLYFYPNFSEKLLHQRIPFYLNSLQIENMELILNNLPWEIIPVKSFVRLLMMGLCKLVIMDLAFLQLSDFKEILSRSQLESTLKQNVYELCRYASSIHVLLTSFPGEELNRLYLQMKLCIFLQSGHKKNIIVGDLFKVEETKLIVNASPNFVKSISEVYIAVDRIRSRKALPIFKYLGAYHYLTVLKDFIRDYSEDIEFSGTEGASSSS